MAKKIETIPIALTFIVIFQHILKISDKDKGINISYGSSLLYTYPRGYPQSMT